MWPFLSREVLSTFVVKLALWWWILLAFTCLQSFWFLQIWIRALLGRTFLVVVFLLHHLKYILPLASGLQSFCWKISCWPYESTFVCHLLLFPCCFQYSLFIFNLGHFNYNVGAFLSEFILYGTLSASWTWVIASFPKLRTFSAIITSKIF